MICAKFTPHQCPALRGLSGHLGVLSLQNCQQTAHLTPGPLGLLLLSGADCSFIKSPTERRKTALKTALKEKYDKIFRRTSERCILGNVQEFKSFLAVAIQGCKWVRDAAMPPLSTSEPELFSLPPTSNQQTPLLSQCGPRSKSKTHK